MRSSAARHAQKEHESRVALAGDGCLSSVTSVRDDETLPRSGNDPDNGSLYLMIGADGAFTTHPLPRDGEVLLGREPTNTIVVTQPSVSRRHARLRIGRTIEIEDLGGANGEIGRAHV